jgi:hypothetical protein
MRCHIRCLIGWCLLALGPLFFTSCSAGGSSADFGVDGAADASADGGDIAATDGDSGVRDGGDDVEGGDDGGAVTDVDLGTVFGLRVPAGTKVCAISGAADVRAAYRNRARIALRPGLIPLPREADTIEHDWIESFEWGPEKTPALAQGPGRFSRTIEGSTQNGTYHFDFGQAFKAGERTATLSFRFSFEVKNGVAVEPLLTLDDSTLAVDPWNDIPGQPRRVLLRAPVSDPQDPYSRELGFITCGTGALARTRVAVGIAGGDELSLVFRCPQHEAVLINLGTVCPCAMESAAFSRAGETRDISDYFRMCMVSYNHCNLNQDTLVVLDSPLGGVFGVHVPGGPDSQQMGAPPTEIEYLDAALSPIETKAVNGWTAEP